MKQKTAEMTSILLKTVSTDTSTPKQFSPTDVQQISSALETVTRNPAYMTSDSAVSLFQMLFDYEKLYIALIQLSVYFVG